MNGGGRDDGRGVMRAAIWDEVLAERRRQIEQFAHDIARDAELPLHALPQKALDYAIIARDCARHGACHNRNRARKNLIKVMALCLAGLEQFDSGTVALRQPDRRAA